MAYVLYIPDGTREIVKPGTEPDDLKYALRDVIERRLGAECAALYDEVNAEPQAQQGDDYEVIADGYLQMLHSAVDELDAIMHQFDGARLNRDKLWNSLRQLRHSINSNL